jgi:hypothetical protein
MEADEPAARFWIALARLAYPAGWFYQDKVWLYRQCQKRSDLRQALASREWHMGDTWGFRRVMDPFMLVFFVPKVVEIFHTCTERTLFVRTALQQAQTASALERYRLAHGQYPATLDALVPAFLTQVPIDALNPATAPLKYQLQGADYFILYSFGLNHVDDKGRIGSVREDPWSGPIPFVRLDEGDWVWGTPQPGKGHSEARSSK